MKYEESLLYQAGVRAIEWGNLLLKADTTLRELADFGDKWDCKIDVGLWAPKPRTQRGDVWLEYKEKEATPVDSPPDQ